jgi:hypothetical protein
MGKTPIATSISNLFWSLLRVSPLLAPPWMHWMVSTSGTKITTLFGYLEPMVSHMMEQTGAAPFSSRATTLAPKANPNRRPKRGPRISKRASGAIGITRDQRPIRQEASFKPNHRRQDREAKYVAEILCVQSRLTMHETRSTHLLCSITHTQRKMALRNFVRARITAGVTGGTTTTTTMSAESWPTTPPAPQP